MAENKNNERISDKALTMTIIFLAGVVVTLFAVFGFFIADKIAAEDAVASATGGLVVSRSDGEGKELSYVRIEVPYKFLGTTRYTTKAIAVTDDAFANITIGSVYDGVTGSIR